MSKGERYPLEQAQRTAETLRSLIEHYVVRVVIAGSIRRRRPDVGDIDLVVELPEDTPWARNIALTKVDAVLSAQGYALEKAGEQIATYKTPVGPGVDLYFATPLNWGAILLIRTGSAAHNIKVAQHARTACLPARKLTHQGIEDTAGRIVAGATEQDVFAAIGMDYREPEDREAPEFEGMVREKEAAGG